MAFFVIFSDETCLSGIARGVNEWRVDRRLACIGLKIGTLETCPT